MLLFIIIKKLKKKKKFSIDYKCFHNHTIIIPFYLAFWITSKNENQFCRTPIYRKCSRFSVVDIDIPLMTVGQSKMCYII